MKRNTFDGRVLFENIKTGEAFDLRTGREPVFIVLSATVAFWDGDPNWITNDDGTWSYNVKGRLETLRNARRW